MSAKYKVVAALSAYTYATIDANGKAKRSNNEILMGSYVRLLDEKQGLYEKVLAFGIEGWIESSALGDTPDMRVFYIDVGQGDAALIEVGNDQNGLRILIDGGPSDNVSRYLSHWQYKYYFDNSKKVHFDYVFISHFDKDHYAGLIDIFNDDQYTFGTVFHNGIAKFNDQKPDFPSTFNTELGKTIKQGSERVLTTTFDDLTSLNQLREAGGMLDLMQKMVRALNNAREQGRLNEIKRADFNTTSLTKLINNKQFKINFLGPVTENYQNKPSYRYFEDEAHTINGHSLVLRIEFGHKAFLFGGDLNTYAENHLLKHYGVNNPFEVDVAKSCHHGASEFTTDFMEKVMPYATVISSGDNESYSHPRADAIGCAGKYSKSNRPLVFSTELARSSNVETGKILYGMINLRCNGDDIIMAQMKEVSTKGKVWDLYEEDHFKKSNP